MTGAAGFIGSHLVRRLTQIGARVTALARPESDLWRLADVASDVQLVRRDVSDFGEGPLVAALDDIEFILHLAAAGVNPSAQASSAMARTNIMGTLAVMQAAERVGAARVVYCGSCSEYGSATSVRENAALAPLSEYGASKAAGWMVARAASRRSGIPMVALRPFAVFGPYEGAQRLIPDAILRALDGSEMRFTAGTQLRDFVYVDDAVDAFLLAITAPDIGGDSLNVCTGIATPVRDVIETIVELSGRGSVPCFKGRSSRADEPPAITGDPSRAEATLGWRAKTPLREGLESTMSWLRERAAEFPEYRRAR